VLVVTRLAARFRTIQVCPKDLRALPGHPVPAVSWHSGFRGGAHARSTTTPVHHAARRRCGVAARGAGAAARPDGDFDHGVAPLGRRTLNTDPLPGSLVNVTSPPIMRASLRVASPLRLGPSVTLKNRQGGGKIYLAPSRNA